MATARKRREGPSTRDRLVGLAYTLVRDEGLSALTIRELANRADVAVGLPHAHFGSREGLLDELRTRAWDEFDGVVDRVIDPTAEVGPETDFEGVVRGCVKAIVDFSFREPNLFELLVVTPQTTVSEAILVREMRTAKRFVDFLVQGQALGVFRFEADPFVFALALWTSIVGYVQRAGADMLPAARKYHARVLDELLEVYFSRIRCVARAEAPPTHPANPAARPGD